MIISAALPSQLPSPNRLARKSVCARPMTPTLKPPRMVNTKVTRLNVFIIHLHGQITSLDMGIAAAEVKASAALTGQYDGGLASPTPSAKPGLVNSRVQTCDLPPRHGGRTIASQK